MPVMHVICILPGCWSVCKKRIQSSGNPSSKPITSVRQCGCVLIVRIIPATAGLHCWMKQEWKVSRMRITLMLYVWKHLHLFMRYLVLKTDGLPFRMHQHKVAWPGLRHKTVNTFWIFVPPPAVKQRISLRWHQKRRLLRLISTNSASLGFTTI